MDILEPEDAPEVPDPDPDATLLDRPACFNVVPTSFFVSGTFSLILVLRVPRSVHVFAEGSGVINVEPLGSTKTWRGVFEVTRAVDAPARDAVRRVEMVDFELAARTGREGREGPAGAGKAGNALHIIRFWKSSCLLCKCSSGDARLAIPRA